MEINLKTHAAEKRWLKWSGKFGQRAKVYPTRTNGCENDKRRNFSDQFKAAVALEGLRGDKTVQEIAAKRQLSKHQNLIDAGADPKAKDDLNKIPWVYAEFNKKLKYVEGYWPLLIRSISVPPEDIK